MAFDGTISGDNKEILRLNDEILELKKLLSLSPAMSRKEYVLDFEKYELDILFSGNTARAKISIENESISISIGDKTTTVDKDGAIVS